MNQLIYRSPEGTDCECCRVSVTAYNKDVYVQFRNSLGGSRDLYLAHSVNGRKRILKSKKLGTRTWKLTACPMDGSGVALSPTGQPITAWRRENTLYLCQPGKPEQAIGHGRNVTVATGSTGPVWAWDDAGMIWLKAADNTPVSLSKGQMPSVAIRAYKAARVWEANGQVMMTSIPL